ncbi:hypothetical protein OOU_Y34scaffold00529g1 [Pyricularia oryzae Y34]|uniref:Cytochrome P450 n=3 Tax=Pyricularia oryzae TaxID=318829 RepID=Q2KER8_PYRO7|nr:hypothetical protein MGCH7_ch7g968 [Pyricularia oryzae 70-15]ELQ38705.1 hypothetical protein OOU_Y34scaffold00529g1 [Pyricularia oryzae Y34]
MTTRAHSGGRWVYPQWQKASSWTFWKEYEAAYQQAIAEPVVQRRRRERAECESKGLGAARVQRRHRTGRDRGCYVLRKSEIASADASRARKKPSGESISQLVSATADHLPFGYGEYACPGRFFVAHEVKPVALCYLLLKHDWKTSENATVPFTIDAGLDALVNPEVKVKYRRRKEEIGLDLPVFGAAEWIEERCSQLGEKWKSPLQRWLLVINRSILKNQAGGEADKGRRIEWSMELHAKKQSLQRATIPRSQQS